MPYLCPSLTLLFHREEGHCQQRDEGIEESRSGRAGGMEVYEELDGRMVEMQRVQTDRECTKHQKHQVKINLFLMYGGSKHLELKGKRDFR